LMTRAVLQMCPTDSIFGVRHASPCSIGAGGVNGVA
jgi:hypothetical protein